MALTPEDIVNKRFQPTKFREGYDQDEVDDFLDEVVVDFRRIQQENDELKQKLSEAEARIAELEAQLAQAQAAPVEAAPVEVAPEPEPAPVVAAAPVEQPVDEADSATNLLQLARRLHEEHVREGLEKRDQLISEGHATAAKLISEAEAAQKASREKFEEEQAVLEQRVEELRLFEKDYRSRLKSYIEGQLQELEANAPLA